VVEDSRTPAGAGGLRLLNQPLPAAVEGSPAGEPVAVIWQGRYQRIRAIADSWRIDDEWWRDEIARRYFVAELESGRRLTLFCDLVTGAWYAQSYEGPQAGGCILRGRAG